MPTYKKPPILEAVIEVQFQDPALSVKDMERFVKRVSGKYPTNDLMRDFALEMSLGSGIVPGAKPRLQAEWYKCSGKDVSDILNIRPQSLVTSRTAPYVSWESLFGSFCEDYEKYAKLFEPKILKRIGSRYINRLDVPSDQSAPVDFRKYLNIFVNFPLDIYDITSNQSLVIEFKFREEIGVIVRCAQLAPVLINKTSLLLDIDVYELTNIYPKKETVFEILDKLRRAKNELFEDLITDEARALFR